MIRTPVTLDRLDHEHAVFVGLAEETTEHMIPFGGTVEVETRYPMVMIQRDQWELHGCPTHAMLVLDFETAPIEDLDQ